MSKKCKCVVQRYCCMCCKEVIQPTAISIKDPFTTKHFTNRNESVEVDTLHFICDDCKDV